MIDLPSIILGIVLGCVVTVSWRRLRDAARRLPCQELDEGPGLLLVPPPPWQHFKGEVWFGDEPVPSLYHRSEN